MGSLITVTQCRGSFCPVHPSRNRTFRLFDYEERANRIGLPPSPDRHNLAPSQASQTRVRFILDELANCRAGALSRYELKAVKLLVDAFETASSEILLVILLSGCGKYLGYEILASGGASKAVGRFRNVIEPVMRRGAHSFVLAHNHPSGLAKPSHADIRATRQLSQLSSALDICFDDHFIIAGRAAYSMRLAGFI